MTSNIKLIEKKIKVTVEAEYTISIDERLLSEEGLKAWSSIMWEVNDPEEIFKHATYLIMKGYTECGHDMIGYLGTHKQTYPQVPDTQYSENEWDITEFEIEESTDANE